MSNTHKAGKWELWQIQTVTRLYPNCPLEEVAEAVGRTPNAVSHFASRNNIRKNAEAEFANRSKARKAEGTHNFKGYRRKATKGYFVRYAPWHPYAGKDGVVMEHRLVMEGILGRILQPDEVVHHIDGNKQNNDPSNLMVMTKTEHSIYHNKRRARK